MPIREESFRIGCGRYIQGVGYIKKCGAEILRLGTSPVIIGDTTSLEITRDKITESISGICKKYRFTVHNGTCNEENAREIAENAKKEGYDVIVGVGGGVIMDFAKLCAYFAALPIVNIPTSSATCAAYAPLSVRYTADGRTVGARHYETEVDAVICDSEIIAAQPTRLLLSGAFDAMAKYLEIKQRFTEESALGLSYAFAMARHSYDVITKTIEKCIKDIKDGNIGFDVENLIFTAIAATGAISGIARGSNQCALAHKFYEAVRFLYQDNAAPYLHGEIVGIGLLLQNYFNGEKENNDSLLAVMKKHNMPYRITDIGIAATDETMMAIYNNVLKTSAIDDTNEEECELFKNGLKYLWNIK